MKTFKKEKEYSYLCRPKYSLFASPRLSPLTPGSCQANGAEILPQPWNPLETRPSQPHTLQPGMPAGFSKHWLRRRSLDTFKLPSFQNSLESTWTRLVAKWNVDSAFSLFLPPAASSLAQVPTPSALSSSQGILPASARQVSSQTVPAQSSLSVKHALDHVTASSETVSVFQCFLD